MALYNGDLGFETSLLSLYSSDREELGLVVSVDDLNGFLGLHVDLGTGEEAYWSAPDLMSGESHTHMLLIIRLICLPVYVRFRDQP